MEGEEIIQIEGVEPLRPGFPCGDEMQVIVDRPATHSAQFGFVEGGEEVGLIERDVGKFRRDLLSKQLGGVRCGDTKSKTPASEGAEGFREGMGEHGMSDGVQYLAAGVMVWIARAECGHDYRGIERGFHLEIGRGTIRLSRASRSALRAWTMVPRFKGGPP